MYFADVITNSFFVFNITWIFLMFYDDSELA